MVKKKNRQNPMMTAKIRLLSQRQPRPGGCVWVFQKFAACFVLVLASFGLT
jgi:hypothetical protein